MPVRRITPADALLLREVRLRALATDPRAFGSTYALEAQARMGPVLFQNSIAVDCSRSCAALRMTGLNYRAATSMTAEPLQFLILLVASWLRRHQGEAIEYLRAENRVLRARLGPKRLRFSDSERRLLAERGKPLGRRRQAEVASLATPEGRGQV
jgi:hypothetical protein